MTSEKRKRQGDGEGRPAKKAATAPPPTGSVKVQHIDDQGVLKPVLASCVGTTYPKGIPLLPYKNTKILPKGIHTELILHSSEHPRLDYLARDNTETLLKDYIGVYDPTTQTLQLVQVPKLTLELELRDAEEEEQVSKFDTRLDRHKLIEEFGSKKAKKALEDERIKEKVRVDPETLKLIQAGIAEAQGPAPTQEELSIKEEEEEATKARPRHNKNAQSVDEVYTVEAVVGKDLLSVIPVKDWVDATKEGKGIEMASRFVAMRVNKFARQNDIQKLKLLKFILLCINFNAALRPRGMNKPKQIPFRDKLITVMGNDVPPAAVDGVRRKFAAIDNDMPSWHIRRLMSYICCAALIVDDFETDTAHLRQDLNLNSKEMKDLYKELGCKILAPNEAQIKKLGLSKAEAATHHFARLQCPPVFPKAPSGYRARK